MQLTFEMDSDSQAITLLELNTFETFVGFPLPEDYRHHMLSYNGSMVVQDVKHVKYPDGGEGISYFDPIKYGSHTMEMVYATLNGKIPSGYLSIGITDNEGHIIMSLNSGATYGNIKEWFPDGEMLYLSPSFTQLLNDMEIRDY